MAWRGDGLERWWIGEVVDWRGGGLERGKLISLCELYMYF